MRIGIPRALLYFIYFPLWKTFFQELGHEVVISSATNKKILDDGVKNCVDDACLPVKLFHGHVLDLIDKSDMIFVPRLVSIEPDEYICPKFIGLPEMIKNNLSRKPKMLVLHFDSHSGEEKGYSGFYSLGKELGASRMETYRALEYAKARQEYYEKLLLLGENPLTLMDENYKVPEHPVKKGTIGLIGHPYLLYDQYINMNICSKLNAKGYDLIFPENISEDKINEACSRYPKKLFWSYGKHLLGSGLTMIEQKNIDGLIFLTSFGCGIDSFIMELLQRANQRDYLIPFAAMTLDEHSGQAGFDTRLEAFTDMLEWRGRIGHNVSPHGESLHTDKSSF